MQTFKTFMTEANVAAARGPAWLRLEFDVIKKPNSIKPFTNSNGEFDASIFQGECERTISEKLGPGLIRAMSMNAGSAGFVMRKGEMVHVINGLMEVIITDKTSQYIDKLIEDVILALKKNKKLARAGIRVMGGATIFCQDVPNVNIESHVLWLKVENTTSLHGIQEMITCRLLNIEKPNRIKSHALGLMLIPRIGGISTFSGIGGTGWLDIINKHIKKGKDLLACQEELIDSGFEDYADV